MPLAELKLFRLALMLLLWPILIVAAGGQTCSNEPDLDAATKSALDRAARQYFDMSTRGDVAGLKANAIPAIAGDFGGIEQAVVANKQFLASGQSTITATYVLDASQAKAPLARADFYCGIYNSPERVDFSISNLPPGKYAIVMQKVESKTPATLTLILQDVGGNSWKLAGYYPRLNAVAGQDGAWYVSKARDYQQKGQLHNAWFCYLIAWELTAPVDFVSTPKLDKLAQEMQKARPSDIPSDASPLSLPAANGKTFRVTELVAVPVGEALDLRIRYNTADASDSGAAYQDNMAIIKAVVAKYPELREAFAEVIARAVDNAGHDYGTVLAMKDVK